MPGMNPRQSTEANKARCANLFLLVFAVFATVASGADEPIVPRWQPHDFSFSARTAPPNPFLTAFTATVSGPDGRTFTVPGFFDGPGTWKVRVAPTAVGSWSLVTQSELPELNGQRAAFLCGMNTNRNVHGILRVDREHPHHFRFEDGTRFFLQGYEHDWLWALDMDRPGVPTVEQSLDLLARHGFNYVILNSYAYDTSWRRGKSGTDDYGPAALYPWEGDNAAPDHSRMNLAYWQHYDRVMAALLERGFEAHIFIKVYNKQVQWPQRGSVEERLFFRWLLARYSAYPNVIWDFSKEAHNEKDLAYKQACLKYFRETDPGQHLMTVHDDDQANDSGAYDALTDFRADQQHSRFHETILRQRARRAWPVANVESDYECGPGGLQDKTYNVAQSPEATLRTAWEIAMAGGYVAYYYTYTAWDVVRPLDIPPGYAYFKHFGDFWRATRYWLLQPADRLVSAGWCLADPGREYVTFQDAPTAFTLEIAKAAAPLQAEWFNPQTGRRMPAGSFRDGVARFTPPPDWGNAPVVLHLARPNPSP